MEKLVLFGAGGSGREIAYLVDRINKTSPTFELLGYIDDNINMVGKMLNGYPVLGNTEWLEVHKEEVLCCVTIGLMKPRVAVCDKLVGIGVRFATLIDPGVSIGHDVTIGKGCIINEYCELPVNIKVGDFCFLNSDTCLGHDDVLGDYVICNPHSVVSGNVTIGNKVMLGGMSFIVQGAKIGDNSVVAPGSVVYGRVKENTHVMGNPARRVDL